MRASRYSHSHCEKNVRKKFTPPFHFEHPLTWVPLSQYFIHGLDSENIFTCFFLGFLQRSGLPLESPNTVCFWFKFGLSVMIWNRVKYFVTNCNTIFFLSLCWPHILEYQCNKVQNILQKKALQLCHTIFLLLENLRMS